jgi:hypothetical protein
VLLTFGIFYWAAREVPDIVTRRRFEANRDAGMDVSAWFADNKLAA